MPLSCGQQYQELKLSEVTSQVLWDYDLEQVDGHLGFCIYKEKFAITVKLNYLLIKS